MWKNPRNESGQSICPICQSPVLETDAIVELGNFVYHARCREDTHSESRESQEGWKERRARSR